MKKIITILGIMAFVVLGAAVYYNYTIKSALGSTNSQAIELPVPTSVTLQPIARSSTKEFTITGKSFSFTPNSMKVNQGDTVKITFINEEGFHDFVLDEFQVRTKQIQKGQQETVQFIADKAGSFEFYCSVGTHRQMGMKGTLEVMPLPDN
ncbi:MAG: Blue (Type 1) copper domain-containing protein [Microgenomates group bacterium GW2011_GWC1_43_11]|uniref:Blue (Type 1) copper domain-containing protein n=2 Tax=Candidatus Gottesmaniibacteriota TaxID=1752720 RepID=A0A0G1ILC4_9BACT|nr:MAG: Blue (Type 1) copper domain-containing protein [Candidatus Gottesmanbacteria bacterium GW2011_GWA2_42_16]KKS90234.1 MAG: Blue (Type 1) copper domain-containing protein [Microgenomates group bacterium GW2011_GWC1_43_11]KKT36382.1 MAG: Blue (Type 1) copper domain-containing protein [Candidatus Gottesmanbacteria bacterium GW2011_GWB1_44_11c]KKT59980.1 MAG: Blue (Type 1) copper domain-containing protein [Candidatus Gottesmanbacteria bacterium GW2011_GWA1_44_24b]HCM81787.1 hypothetical prote